MLAAYLTLRAMKHFLTTDLDFSGSSQCQSSEPFQDATPLWDECLYATKTHVEKYPLNQGYMLTELFHNASLEG